jgi:rhodanese-related sulfurtransferase
LSLAPQIEITDALAAFKQGNFLFLDARSPEDYKAGHIPGAINLPVYDHDDLTSDFIARTPLTASIIVYCAGIQCDDSHTLANNLRSTGFSQVSVFSSGMPAWRAAGLTVTMGDKP